MHMNNKKPRWVSVCIKRECKNYTLFLSVVPVSSGLSMIN